YWNLKFALMAIANTVVGYGGGFYMIMVVNLANTVEYNEWKTGKRNESLIFSLRPFTAKMGSALMQALVIAVYAVANVTDYTNGISAYERDASRGIISNEVKNAKIAEIIKDVSLADRRILISCMCLIPAVFLAVALIIYKKKCILTESRLTEMIKETEARKASENPPAEEVDATPQTENAA
ncbi:MAG: MFS transporter, partial [Christensenellaceae bacterium]|nr:MFS transporter [Christensenellaceae bacterium]